MDRLDMQRVEQAMRWEPWKALAAFVVATLVFLGLVIALAHWFGPRTQTITVHVFIEKTK